MSAQRLPERVLAVCDSIEPRLNVAAQHEVQQIRRRMTQPMRVAIAGRAKAGKSTLLNALVGERLAATDAAEITRVVTWYEHGLTYDVAAVSSAGTATALPFRWRERLEIDVDAGHLAGVERLRVQWPAAQLRQCTLIDTPGLASTDEVSSARTRRALLEPQAAADQVDAVIYLMRHVHRMDVDFLEAFADPLLVDTSPVHSIAVLSRADEIGSGRRTGLHEAGRAARQFAQDPRIAARCSGVVPVAGLLAEAAATLSEREARQVQDLAATPPETVDDQLLSADRFLDANGGGLTREERGLLLQRLGLVGVRWAVDAARAASNRSSIDLARALRELSGIETLTALIDDKLASRADTLKARSALVALLRLAHRDTTSADVAHELAASVEEIEANSPEFQDMRLWHLMATRGVRLSDAESAEVARITANTSALARLSLPADAPADEARARAVAGVQRWRRRAGDPLARRDDADACEAIARVYERIHHSVAGDPR